MNAIADIFTGAGGAADAARNAAQQVQFQPFNIFGGELGSVRQAGDGGIRLSGGGLQHRLGGQLEQGVQQLLRQSMGQGPFGTAGINLAALDRSLGQFGLPGANVGPRQGPQSNITPQGIDPTLQQGGIPDPTTTIGAPGATVSGVQQFGGLGDLLGAGRGSLAAAGAARQALGSFDTDAFASTQFERLNALAQSGEETEAQQLLERLHGSGRLGVRQGGQQQELAELATAQEMSRNQRLLQAVGLAGQEQDRLTQQATAFGGLGQGLVSSAGGLQQAGQQLGLGAEQALFSQLMSGAGLRTQQQGQLFDQRAVAPQMRLQQQQGLFEQLMAGSQHRQAGQQAQFGQQMAGREFEAQQAGRLFEQLMGRQQFGTQTALTRFGAAQEALGTGLNQRQQGVGQALNILGGLQSLQQSPLALLSQSIGAGMGGLQASQARAGMVADAAQAEAQANSQFFGGLMSAAGNMFNFGG